MKYFFALLLIICLSSCSLVSTLVDEGDPPVIKELSITPNDGPAPLLSAVSWSILSSSEKPVTCTLDFGDGTQKTLEDCANLSDTFYTYEKPGGYILVLTATLGKQETKRTVPVTVQSGSESPNNTLAITELLVTPNNSTAPMLSAVKWQITGAEDAVRCELDFGDGAKTTVDNCSQVKDTFHTFEKEGGYVLILTAKEGDKPSISKSFPVTVQRNPSPPTP